MTYIGSYWNGQLDAERAVYSARFTPNSLLLSLLLLLLLL